MNVQDGGWREPPRVLDPSWALFLDVDGTLLDIADEPQAVKVPSGLVPALSELFGMLGGALALVSGRPIAELDRLFAPLVLPAAGQHGAEQRLAAGEPVRRHRVDPILPALIPEVRAIAAVWPGVEVEEKGAAIAVHFRREPEAEVPLTRALRAMVEATGGSIELLEGKMVRELRDCHHTKGSAVGTFMAVPPFSGRRPIFVADDVTDEDGFLAVETVGGLAMVVGVNPAIDRAPAFSGAAAVRKWLARLAEADQVATASGMRLS